MWPLQAYKSLKVQLLETHTKHKNNSVLEKMDCQYLLGAILASVLGLLLLYKKIQKQTFSMSSDNGLPRDSEIGRSADIIIVGAGVAGSALAYTLGKDGRQVKVIERDLTEPDRIVGELLQPGGYLKLMELGLEECVNGIDAQRVFGYALFKDGKSTKLSYPLQHFESDVAGRSFHNGRFIQRMREKASTLPKIIHVDIPPCFVALVLENCQLPYANHGHVILADPSPILFYPISSTEVRCLVDVPGQKVPSVSNGEMSHFLKTEVAPQIPSELYNTFISAINKGNIRTMPNRSMPASPYPTPGALLMGDAFNMRHPLTGGGMTVALSDIVVLRDLLRPLRDLNDASALCKYLESFYTLRKPTASTIYTLAGALYKVFSGSSDPARREMRKACFDYLSLGGVFSNGPIALLSGMNPRPLNLILHFFAVAVYGFGRLLLPFPSFKRLLLGARLISAGIFIA
ncbi:PREDICTED: squalene monooxygenase [Theobroma cacao]|uniref:Squalene monooxygenase n=1 Tax=Theobroma cacao TaxID=3641 RepID=A0AB32W368_THECC|nr:PREDICTED: squalene monooxygenase [Theobroma cacao]